MFENFIKVTHLIKKATDGLSIVKRVVELCGPSAKSAPGEGSVFTVTLPVKTTQTQQFKGSGKITFNHKFKTTNRAEFRTSESSPIIFM